MHDAMQKLLDELTSRNDKRINVFDIQYLKLDNETLSLSGKLLHQDQLAALEGAFSNHFPSLNLDTTSVQILSHAPRERVHVATNLTGLYEKPTFGMPLSSELYFGTELEVLDEQGKWVFARQRDEYLGWVYRSYLGEGLAPDATHLVLAPSVEVRVEPNETSKTATRVVSGTGVTVAERLDGWSRISANKTGWIPSSALRALTELPQTIEQKRATLIEDSMRMIGVPYLWGGSRATASIAQGLRACSIIGSGSRFHATQICSVTRRNLSSHPLKLAIYFSSVIGKANDGLRM